MGFTGPAVRFPVQAVNNFADLAQLAGTGLLNAGSVAYAATALLSGSGALSTSGSMSGNVAPAKETWQPTQVKATQSGTQVGPSGQYAVHNIALADLVPQTSAGFASGNVTLTTPNQTYIGIKFTGKVTNHTSGCEFYSCEFQGNSSSASILVDCTNSSSGTITFYDCYFNPTLINCGGAIQGGNFTVWRSDIWRTTDGLDPQNITGQANANCYIYNNYIHDLCADLTDPSHYKGSAKTYPGPSHNDCIQLVGGNNIEVIGNTLMAYVDQTFGDGPSWNAGTATTSGTNGRQFGPNYQCNSAIQSNQDNGKPMTSGVKINYNNFGGGTICVNLAWNNLNTLATIDEVIGNTWLDWNQGGPYTSTMGTHSSYTVEGTSGQVQVRSASGNKYWDGTAIDFRVKIVG